MAKELPKNWALPKIKQIVKYQKGKKPKILNEEEFDGSVPYLDIKAFEKGEVRRYADTESSTLIEKDEIGIVWDGARSGWVSKNKKGAVGSTIAILKPQGVNSDLLFRFLQSKFDYLNTNTRGIGIPHVDSNVLWNIDFPLPPLPEQTRIVVKLDQLFGQLEQIKESLDKIPQLLKDFRQQVLTQAVTGKLTEDWREGKKLQDPKSFYLEEICSSITDGDHQAPPRVENGIPFLVISNISKGYFDFEGVTRFVPRDYFEALKDTRVPKAGDILYTVTGSFGIPLLVDFDKEFCFQRHIAILRPNTEVVLSEYLLLHLKTNDAKRQAELVAKGTAQLTVPLRGLRKFNFIIHSLNEQQEIVARVETLFAKADIIEQQYQTLKQKIDILPQAIMHKAFKGELVPQLNSDGDARELLEQIKALKKQSAKPNVRVSPSASSGQAKVEPLITSKNPNVKTKTSLKSGQAKVEPSKNANPNDRVSPSASSGQAKVDPSKNTNPNVRVSAVEPLKKSKAYKVEDVELGRVAEEGEKV